MGYGLTSASRAVSEAALRFIFANRPHAPNSKAADLGKHVRATILRPLCELNTNAALRLDARGAHHLNTQGANGLTPRTVPYKLLCSKSSERQHRFKRSMKFADLPIRSGRVPVGATSTFESFPNPAAKFADRNYGR
jgi:hypothetical protein